LYNTEMSQTTQSVLKNFHLCKLYMRSNGMFDVDKFIIKCHNANVLV